RELQRLGADSGQLAEFRQLFADREALQKADQIDPFTAQSGTFSALAGRIFTTGSDDPQKKIAKSTEETAKNTRTIAKNSGPVRYQ
ncbi:MAG: hypothetical protein HUJ26_00140, partial [Planctomycetaceae bacterium]|nr:hypothetical protein [Planctomycetaceae bacterium]